jgi:hypothetical protein
MTISRCLIFTIFAFGETVDIKSGGKIVIYASYPRGDLIPAGHPTDIMTAGTTKPYQMGLIEWHKKSTDDSTQQPIAGSQISLIHR